MSTALDGLTWSDVVADWVARRGSLAAVAEHLASRRAHREAVETIERGLRRLRDRGQSDGGVWGRRGLSAFGLPTAAVDRVRWMGTYHSRFTDLPQHLGAEILRPWERPPVSEAPARAWVLLARAGLHLRARDTAGALEPLRQAALVVGRAGPGAVVEHRLVAAFVEGRRDRAAAPALLDEAAAALQEAGERADPDDLACWRARLVDQRAYPLNRPPKGVAPDHAAARDLYAAMPDTDVPPFARCRRANGLAWSLWSLGERDDAIALARESVRHAGDAGSLRMRAMALLALARFIGGAEGGVARARAAAIAARLEDEALAVRAR